jgi:hypothetical protein
MTKHLLRRTHFDQKRMIESGLLLLVLMVLLFALPKPPAGAQELDSDRVIYTSANGQSTIVSQQIVLEADNFANAGTFDKLQATQDGLTLAESVTSGVYLSEVIRSPLDFTTDVVPLWRADLPQETGLVLETRLSLDDGHSWSEWLEMPEAFYPVRDDEHSGNLIWVGSDRAALQMRVTLQSTAKDVSPTLNSVTLVFNDTSAGPTDGDIVRQMTLQRTSIAINQDVCPAMPYVVSRTNWGCPDGQVSPRRPPVYHPVTHIIIHHTETPNQTDPYQDWAGWIRSVWNYHANVLWWGDVGYNYLIDPNGVIYEGRAGGDDVVGIHDTHNYGSMAIGFLGCYGDCDDPRLNEADPSEAMLASGADLMAWKLGQKGIDPLSTAPYHNLPDVPVIAGGRDVTSTSSPGSRLYNQLPNLRQTVQDKIEQCSTDTTVFVDPVETQLCEGSSAPVTTQVKIAQVTNLQGFAFKLNFDPNVVNVVDADPSTPDVVEIRLGESIDANVFFVARNTVDNGLIDFAGAFQGNNALNGDAILAEIDWLPVRVSDSPLTFSEVKLSDPDANEIQRQVIDGAVEVSQCTGVVISGRILLSGRDDHSGTEIFLSGSPYLDEIVPPPPDAITDSNGDFEIMLSPGQIYQYLYAFQFGYLGGRRESPQGYLGILTLPGGDVVRDDEIDIFDLTYIASRYDSNDPTADVNADGLVDIFDMVITANNYGKQGPVEDWLMQF